MNQASPNIRKLMKAAENALSKGNGAEAMPLLQQVLAINPAHAQALHKIGFIFNSAGNFATAETYYQHSMAADARLIENYIMLAYIFDQQRRSAEALQIMHHATQVLPDEPRAHATLVAMMLRHQQSHLVLDYLARMLPQFPNDLELHAMHCKTLQMQGHTAQADATYKTLCEKFRPDAAFRLSYETYMPRLAHSNEEIERARENFSAAVERFIVERPRINPLLLACSPFFFAFHNRDNKALLQRYTTMLRTIAPELSYTAPYCKGPQVRDANAPIRLAFLSAYMYKHSVGDCYRGSMIYLAQQPEFEVLFINTNNIHDAKIQEILDAGVRMETLQKNTMAVRRQIEAFRPDIMVYPDIGMDIATHCVAHSRFARHQVCFQGHPDTTGIDTIDYVISTRAYEPPHAQENYTETLLCLDGIDTVFTRPVPPLRWLTRQELGLPEDKKLYVCPMAIQKFHPDFDDTLAAILARDPNGMLVLFNDYIQESATSVLKDRILSTCDPARVIFLPWQPLEVLYSILKTCDAMLDTFYFGAGTTAQHAFGLGIPIVTMPGRWARGRMVHAYYSLAGIENPPEADTPQAYVELAYRLANDAAYKEGLSQQLLARNQRMFERSESGPRLAQLMKDIMAGTLDAYRK